VNKKAQDNSSDAHRKHVELRNSWTQKLVQVTGKQNWLTFNPESHQNLIAETMRLRHLHQSGQCELTSEAWRVRLVPHGQFIVDETEEQVHYVPKSYDCGFVGWPARQIRPDCWSPDADCKALVWKFCTDFEKPFKVLSTTIQCLARYSAESRDIRGIMCHRTGPALPILEWQAQHGFASVSEGAMKSVLADRGVELPVEATDGDIKDELAVLAMKSVYPKWSSEDALKAFRKGHSLTNVDAGGCLLVDEEMMRDVLHQTESAELRSYMQRMNIAKAKLTMHKCKAKENTTKHFKAKRAAKGGSSGSGGSEPSLARWLPGKSDLTPSATSGITKNKTAARSCRERLLQWPVAAALPWCIREVHLVDTAGPP